MEKKAKTRGQNVKTAITSKSARKITQYGLLLSIMVLMTLFPIGFIKLGIVEATLMHIPVIVGAMLFGVKGGAFFGFCFGAASLINGFISPTALSMALLGSNSPDGFGMYNLFLEIGRAHV